MDDTEVMILSGTTVGGKPVSEMVPDPSRPPALVTVDGTLVNFWYDPPIGQFGKWVSESGGNWMKDMPGYLRACVHSDDAQVLEALITTDGLGSQRMLLWCTRLSQFYTLVQFGLPFDPKGLDSGDSSAAPEKKTSTSSASGGTRKSRKSPKSSTTSTATS